jgi:hypothetical protein
MKLIAIAALTLSLNAFADGKTSDSKPLELPDFSHLQQPSKNPAKDGVSFSADMNCKTTDGQSFTSGDAGFETCVATQKGKAQ